MSLFRENVNSQVVEKDQLNVIFWEHDIMNQAMQKDLLNYGLVWAYSIKFGLKLRKEIYY